MEDASVRPSTLRAYWMTMDRRPRQMPRVGSLCSRAYLRAPIFAVQAADAEAAGHGGLRPCCAAGGSASSSVAQVGCNPLDVDLPLFAKPPARRASETDRYASGRSMYSHQANVDLCCGAVHCIEQAVPLGEVQVGSLNAEVVEDVVVELLAVQGLGDVVDAGCVGAGDDCVAVHVACVTDLGTVRDGDLTLTARRIRPSG